MLSIFVLFDNPSSLDFNLLDAKKISLIFSNSQIVSTVAPKMIRELDAIHQEALLLQNKMQNVQQDVQKVEQDTALAMDSLLKIDAAKQKMTEVEKSLQEIDNWATLTQEIDEVFASADAELISSKLFEMQNSLEVLGTKVNKLTQIFYKFPEK